MKGWANMTKVLKAQAYNEYSLGSFGNASNMLIRQFQFPAEYDYSIDVMVTADSDRLLAWDYSGFRECLEKHIGHGELAIGSLVRAADKTGRYIMSDDDVFAFLKQALKVDKREPVEEWTGYRVTGTVNRSTGYTIFTLQLFANKSGVDVYSGDDGKNVDSDIGVLWDNMGLGRVGKRWQGK